MWATDQKGFICMQLATLLEQGDCVTGLWRTRCTFMCTKLNAKVAITDVYSEPQHYFSSPTLCCNTNTLSATYICFIFSAPCENNRNKYIFYTAVLLRAGALSFFLERDILLVFISLKKGAGGNPTNLWVFCPRITLHCSVRSTNWSMLVYLRKITTPNP